MCERALCTRDVCFIVLCSVHFACDRRSTIMLDVYCCTQTHTFIRSGHSIGARASVIAYNARADFPNWFGDVRALLWPKRSGLESNRPASCVDIKKCVFVCLLLFVCTQVTHTSYNSRAHICSIDRAHITHIARVFLWSLDQMVVHTHTCNIGYKAGLSKSLGNKPFSRGAAIDRITGKT